MTWFDTLTSAPVLVAGLVGISAALFVRGKDTHQVQEQAKDVAHSIQADSSKAKMAQTVSDNQIIECLLTSSPPRSCLPQQLSSHLQR